MFSILIWDGHISYFEKNMATGGQEQNNGAYIQLRFSTFLMLQHSNKVLHIVATPSCKIVLLLLSCNFAIVLNDCKYLICMIADL